MVAKGKVTRETSQTVNPSAGSTEKKVRPQHSQCHFSKDYCCANRASLFYGQTREPEAPVCSNFLRSEA